MNSKQVTTNIRRELKDYIQRHHLKSLVIGVSGGIDSTVCCALARPVCDELDIPLIGRSLPTNSNTEEEQIRADKTGKIFCTDYKEVNIRQLFRATDSFLALEGKACTVKGELIRRGNIKARARMIYLYNLAFIHGGMVLSTDNLTEYYLGFFTLHGDHNDYGPIQNLWKTEVYELAQYLVEELEEAGNTEAAEIMRESIEAIPTDGLGITDSDLDQIGAKDYAEVDIILKTWLCFSKKEFEDPTGTYTFPGRPEVYGDFAVYPRKVANHPVVKRYERTHFKRLWPISIDRKKIFQEQ